MERTDCSQGNCKKLEGEEPTGHGPLLLSRGIMFNVQALAVFNAEQEDVPPAHRCAPAAENVYVLSTAFSNFKLNAFVGMTPYHGSVTRAMLDTGAGPKLVRESFLPQKVEEV